MSEPIRGIVAAHGPLATALVAAVEQISGVEGALIAVSNSGCDRGLIEERIADAVGAGPAVIFVDMPSGSCLFAAMRRMRESQEVRVVTGVNLAMLVDFVFHRTLPIAEASARAVDAGTRAIRIP
jgi:mannose/fructose-specific phosphotransferase system component IIA